MKDLKKLNKAELMEIVCDMEDALIYLEDKLNHKTFKPGRKEQVHAILKQGPITVGAIATRVGISARNVSSQLCYLRKAGINICTTSTGKKFIAE